MYTRDIPTWEIVVDVANYAFSFQWQAKCFFFHVSYFYHVTFQGFLDYKILVEAE